MHPNTGYIKTREVYSLPECRRCGNPSVDRHHRDRDPTNLVAANVEPLCRRCHRQEDSAESSAGARRRGPLTGQFKGICWLPRVGRWLVQIRTPTGDLRLGTHRDEEEAALVYDAAVLHYWQGDGYFNLLAIRAEGVD